MSAGDPGQAGDLRDRLGACTDRIDELLEQLHDERTRRNQLIVAAHDNEGAGLKTIARWAKVSKALVNSVLSAN